MKKRLIAVNFLLALVLLSSCSNKGGQLLNDDISQTDSLLSQVQVDGALRMKYQYTNTNQLAKAEIFEDGDLVGSIHYQYDVQGRLSQLEKGNEYRLLYQYNNQQAITEIKEFVDGIYRQTYNIEKNGSEFSLSALDPEGNATTMRTQVDSMGNVLKQLFEISGNVNYNWQAEWGNYDRQKVIPGDADGLFSLLTVNKNNPGFLKFFNSMEPDKILFERYEYRYNASGLPIEKKTFDKNGVLKETWTYKYISKK